MASIYTESTKYLTLEIRAAWSPILLKASRETGPGSKQRMSNVVCQGLRDGGVIKQQIVRLIFEIPDQQKTIYNSLEINLQKAFRGLEKDLQGIIGKPSLTSTPQQEKVAVLVEALEDVRRIGILPDGVAERIVKKESIEVVVPRKRAPE